MPSEFNAPGVWTISRRGRFFHFVSEGSCWLKTSSGEALRLESGDVVLLPRGAGHSLRDQLNSPTTRIHEVVDREQVGETTYRMRVEGTGTRSLLVCCAVGFELSVHPLLELMPEVLHVRGGGSHDPSLLPLLEAMASRNRESAGRGRHGHDNDVADIVITRVVRGWADSRTEDTTGWLAAIRDPQIGKALAAFHRRPSEAWSVVSLAAAAAAVVLIFSERFAAVLGTSARSIRRAMAYGFGRHVATRQAADRLQSGDTTRLRIRGLLQPCVQTVHGGISQHVSATPHGRRHRDGQDEDKGHECFARTSSTTTTVRLNSITGPE